MTGGSGRRAGRLVVVAALTSSCWSGAATAVRAPDPVASTGTPTLSPSARALPPAFTRSVFGHSVQGRPLEAWTTGSSRASTRLLVVGVVHGDETAGLPIARRLMLQRWPSSTELVVVPDLNPDGAAVHTRQNAHRVDLNRNFPYGWQHLGRPGDQQYSGTGPLSEPESAALAALVRRLRPTVTVWFHQPVGVVDDSGGAVAIERRFAVLLGEPLRRMVRYPGSAVSWQDVVFPGTTAFVVELPRQVSASLLSRAVAALRDLAR